MFGYQEEKYEVLKTTTINTEGVKQIIEIRKREEYNEEYKAQLKKFESIVKNRGGVVEKSNNSPYISLIGLNNEGNVILDYLFYYDFENSFKEKIYKTEEEIKDLLEEDFAKLIDPKSSVNVKDLNAYRRIEHHHTGHTKCGCVTMY